MGKQSEAFLSGEGNAWYERNKLKSNPDPVLAVIKQLDIKPKSVFEVGCGDGKRLMALHQEYRTQCMGLDASRTAVDIAKRYAPIRVWHSTAINMPIGSVEMVIFGFCLYVCDPEELTQIVANGDRLLKEGGHLIIHDFLPEAPCYRPYHHKDGIKSYKMDHAKLWLAHPAYSMVHREVLADGVAVTVLQKNMEHAFPRED